MINLSSTSGNQPTPNRVQLLQLLAFCDSILLLVLLSVVHFYLPGFDDSADKWLGTLQSAGSFNFFDTITDLGNFLFVLAAAFLTLIYFLARKNWRSSISLVVTVFGGALFGYCLKVLFSKTHNVAGIFIPNNTDLGFPSGHTLMALLFYGWLAFEAGKMMKNNKWKWPAIGFAILLVLLVGFSRLMISVHLLTDVISGWAAGFVWFIASVWLSDWILSITFRK